MDRLHREQNLNVKVLGTQFHDTKKVETLLRWLNHQIQQPNNQETIQLIYYLIKNLIVHIHGK